MLWDIPPLTISPPFSNLQHLSASLGIQSLARGKILVTPLHMLVSFGISWIEQFPSQRKRKWERWQRSMFFSSIPWPKGNTRKLHPYMAPSNTSPRLPSQKAPLSSAFNILLKIPEWLCLTHHTPHSALTQLSWWKLILSCPPVKCCLTTLPMVDLEIYVDASTSWGIGLCIGNHWVAWRLVPGWNNGGHDIGWAEAVTLELAAMWLAETDHHDVCAVIHSDTRGWSMCSIRGDRETWTAMIAFSGSPYYWLFQIFLSSLLLSPLVSTKCTPSLMVYLVVQNTISVLLSYFVLNHPHSESPCLFLMSSELHSNEFLQYSSYSELASTWMGALQHQQLIKPWMSWQSDNHILWNALQPHVAAANRILLWTTPFGLCDKRFQSNFLPTHIITWEHLVVTHTIFPKALRNYAARLLRFTCFCDDPCIIEDLCMPAPEWLLSALWLPMEPEK